MARCILALACLSLPTAAYVAPASGKSAGARQVVAQRQVPHAQDVPRVESGSSTASIAVASLGFGAVLGWLNTRKHQAASAAAAAAVAVMPVAATAIVDYDAIKYLGGSDKVDLNNANVQAYRQFPGMFPTAAGAIATHGPFKQVSEIYDIPGLDDRVKAIMKKYEGNFVVTPPNQPYFIDRINNGMYR